jgi:tetratricopeptide (TPR) repeat protein
VLNSGIVLLTVTVSITTLPACQLSAADMDTYRRAASAFVANRDFNNALSWADKGLKLAPEDPQLNLRKGEALVALSQPKDALAVLAKTPATGESQFFRGLAYQLLEDHRSAQQSFLEAWNRGNQDPYVLYSLMREDKELGDKEAGIEHFKLMLARFPDSVWIHVLLGDAHFQRSEEAEARQEYLAAVKLMPDLFEPNFRLAYLTFEAGEYGSSAEYYRRALAAKPHHTEANVYLGEALRRDHRLPEAITQLKRAIQLDPKVPLAYTSLAKSQVDAGLLPEAVDTLCAAEKEFPDDSSFPGMRSRILAQMGKPQDAELAAQRAREIMNQRLKKQSAVNQ